MSYGFLLGLMVLGAVFGTVGFIAAGRERERARARLQLAKGTIPSGPRRTSAGSMAMLHAMAREQPDKFPANRPASRPLGSGAVGSVYLRLWQKAK